MIELFPVFANCRSQLPAHGQEGEPWWMDIRIHREFRKDVIGNMLNSPFWDLGKRNKCSNRESIVSTEYEIMNTLNFLMVFEFESSKSSDLTHDRIPGGLERNSAWSNQFSFLSLGCYEDVIFSSGKRKGLDWRILHVVKMTKIFRPFRAQWSSRTSFKTALNTYEKAQDNSIPTKVGEQCSRYWLSVMARAPAIREHSPLSCDKPAGSHREMNAEHTSTFWLRTIGDTWTHSHFFGVRFVLGEDNTIA
jgi:hypothetical protein